MSTEVLIAVDHPDDAEAARRSLAGLGNLHLASSAASLRELGDASFSVALVSLGPSGPETVRAWRSEGARFPVVFLADREATEAELEVGFALGDDVVRAPIDEPLLRARVRGILARRGSARIAEAQRSSLYPLLMQAPAAIAVFAGPEHVYELANPAYERMVNKRGFVGLSIRSAFPEAEGQGLFELMDEVYATGEPKLISELPVKLARAGEGQLDQGYYSFNLEPLRDGEGVVTGLIAVCVELTEQVNARRRAEAARAELNAIFDQVPAIVGVVTAPEQRYVLANPWLRALYGHRPLLGRTRREAHPEHLGQGIPDIVERVIRTGERWSGHEVRVELDRENDGRLQEGFFDIIYEPMKDEAGRVTAVVLFAVEVTDEVRARQRSEVLAAELKQSEQRFRRMFELAAAGMAQADASGRFHRVNAKLCEITGYSEDELRAIDVLSLTHPDDRAAERERFEAMIAGKREGYVAEKRYLRKDGTTIWVEVSATRLGEPGSPELRTVAIVQDITERRQARASLEASEHYFRSLVENLPELAWTADARGVPDFYNRSFTAFTGLPPEQLMGEGWVRLHDPDTFPEVMTAWDRAMAMGEPFERELRLRGGDGELHWFLVRIRPLRDTHGTIVRWFGIGTNIDEQRRQAAALREAVAVRDTFLSIASHELKTPLTPLALKLQALTREVRNQPDSPFVRQVERHIELSRRQLTRLTKLVNDLLDVTRIGGNKLHLEPEPLDFVEVVREVVARYEPIANAKIGVHGVARADGETDRLRFEQVVTNLLDNALKYGAGKPVALELTEADGRVVLSVRDEGIGIAAHDLGRVFERFERAVSERNYGGLGLGLFIARSITEALGGKIEVTSELGRGTEFRVSLPRVLPPAGAVGATG